MPDETRRRQWLTRQVYTLLWRLYERHADLLEGLEEEDVEPLVALANEAYSRLHPWDPQAGSLQQETKHNPGP